MTGSPRAMALDQPVLSLDPTGQDVHGEAARR
jgi:hypothetical protein